MKAIYDYKGEARSMAVWIEKRQDGSSGPPFRFTITEKSGCPDNPVSEIHLQLESVDPDAQTAQYRVIHPGQNRHTS